MSIFQAAIPGQPQRMMKNPRYRATRHGHGVPCPCENMVVLQVDIERNKFYFHLNYFDRGGKDENNRFFKKRLS
jgi:hypothetical protein